MHLVKGATQAAAVGAALLLGTSAYTVSFAAAETAAKASISPEFVWLLVGLLFGLGCFVLLLLANIAKRRRAENELLKYKKDLEAKVERRTVQLSALNQNLADQIDIVKKSEEVLRENERKLALLFGNLPGMVYRAERKKRWQLEFVSGGCETLTGYTPDELLEGDRRFYTDTVMAEDDRAHVRKEIFESASAGEPYRVHYKVHTREGIDRWVWDQGQGVFDADGKLIALEGFVGDLTERVQVEENLRESEERYRGLVEASPDAIIVHQDGQIVFLNNAALDLVFAIPESITRGVGELLEDQSELDLIILNAGRLGVFGDLGEAELFELKTTMQVNLWANKTLLDAVFALNIRVHQVVTISSGAAVNGNRGWSGYSISKAALNMLTQLYAKERPDTHFCALAPGVVDTAIQDELLEREPDARFPAVEVLRSKRNTTEMPKPREAALRLIEIFEKLPSLVESGDFADIRNPPLVG